MEIMETVPGSSGEVKDPASTTTTSDPSAAKEPKPEKSEKDNIFSDQNLPKDSSVEVDSAKDGESVALSEKKREVVITPLEKAAFIDSVVSNTRFVKDYSLFGGKVKFTVRSLTVDEVNALASWTVKVGSSDSAGLVSGRYRKYLAAAQIAMFNGTEMPPLEEPLFETLESDGRTVKKPGWIDRCAYWDGVGIGVFTAIMSCLSDFDQRYAALCKEAENANFWNPDTP
jgi:hypothetical protein